jgi:hypothetical protein
LLFFWSTGPQNLGGGVLSKIITSGRNPILFTIYDAHFVCEMYARTDKSVRACDKNCTHVRRGYLRKKKTCPRDFFVLLSTDLEPPHDLQSEYYIFPSRNTILVPKTTRFVILIEIRSFHWEGGGRDYFTANRYDKFRKKAA